MSKKALILIVTSVLATFFAAVLFAGTTVQDTFKLESKEYTKRTYNSATLTHKKHVEDYKITCGECHHNDKNEPLDTLKTGDNVQRCIECHKIPSQKPKGPAGKGLTDAQQREYHAEALHDNCRGCHKKFNKKVKAETGKKGKAPTSCNKCHKGGKIK